TEVDLATAQRINETFNEVIIAPSYTPDALEALASKKNLRVIETGAFKPKVQSPQVRGIVGGLLVMDRDLGLVGINELKVVTSKTPSREELEALLFAWRCVKWVKSNAIVYTSHNATVGMGAGQMSRVDSARFGAMKARKPLHGL